MLTSASALVVYELSRSEVDIVDVGNLMDESGSANAYFSVLAKMDDQVK